MPPEARKLKNPKSCFLNLSYTSGDSPNKIERIITKYFLGRGFEVKTGRMAQAGEKIDKGVLQVIKSCGFGIVVYNELRHNISYEWGIMDALDIPVIPFLNKDTHIDLDRDLSDKKGTNFVKYSGESEEMSIIEELENSESFKSALENIEVLIAEQISSEETDEVKEVSRLLTESNIPLISFPADKKEVGAFDSTKILNVFFEIKDLTSVGHFFRANAYYYAGDFENAEKEYGKAIRIDPDYAAAHNNLGVLFKDLKRYEEAEKEYGKAIRIDPDYAAAHNNLGVLFKDLKRYEEAEKEYGK
ncbi:MAG: tetratricopeptide repeat protein, partial [Halobacteriota archaeon]|nr:tetratricopeptide repeat protein [Halobacteriota archaeon]